jgi:hypothetical protein
MLAYMNDATDAKFLVAGEPAEIWGRQRGQKKNAQTARCGLAAVGSLERNESKLCDLVRRPPF